MTVEDDYCGEILDLEDDENQMSIDSSGDEHESNEDHQNTLSQDDDDEEQGVALDRKMHDFMPHNGEPVYSLDVHPLDKTFIVTGGGDDVGRIFKYVQMEEEVQLVAELGGHTDSVIAVKFNFDGSLVATAGMDGLIKIWNGLTGAPVHSLEGANEIVWIDWHPKGSVIAAGAEDGTVWMWNASTGICMHVFAGNSLRSNQGMFSPDGKWLVSCGEGHVYVWNPKEGNAAVVYDKAQGHGLSNEDYVSLAINPASTIISAGAADGTISVLRLHHFEIINTLSFHSDSVEGLAFSPKLNVLASAGLDAKFFLWDMNNYTLRFQTDAEEITSLKWISEPDTIATASANGIVSVRDGRSGAILDQMGLKDVTCLEIYPIPTMQLMFCAYENGRLVSFAY
jgi:ribosome assembly protein SQT1